MTQTSTDAPGVSVDPSIADSCLLCGAAELGATQDEFQMADILGRWEQEVGVKFNQAVWAQYTGPDSRITLYRCPRCGFAIFKPILAGSTDFYKCLVNGDGTSYYISAEDKWEYSLAVRDLRRHQCESVLEIGCGSGSFLDVLRDRVPNIRRVGFELNEEMARLVRDKGHHCYSGESLAVIDNEKFEAICIFHTLEHVAEPHLLLKTMRRLLKTGGVLLLAVPDNAGPVRYFSTALTDMPPHHVSRWRANTFSLGLPRFGFEVLRLAFEPLHASLYTSYLPPMLENSRLPKPIVRFLLTNSRLVRLLSALRIRWIRGVHGQSIYVSARAVGPAD
jgi:SAM-dependent methyltransferase